MIREVRTSKEVVANQLDLEIFNLAQKIERYATAYKWKEAAKAARIIAGQRSVVRQHMHPEDRKGTEG